MVFPNGSGLFQQDNAPGVVQERFEEHDKEFKSLTRPLNSPDLNPIERLWDALGKQVRSTEARPRSLQDLKDLLPLPSSIAPWSSYMSIIGAFGGEQGVSMGTLTALQLHSSIHSKL